MADKKSKIAKNQLKNTNRSTPCENSSLYMNQGSSHTVFSVTNEEAPAQIIVTTAQTEICTLRATKNQTPRTGSDVTVQLPS
jgi:hypothetical protein